MNLKLAATHRLPRILVIEDNPNLRDLLEAYLQKLRAILLFASSLAEGKMLLDAYAPKIIVCNFNLGEGSDSEISKKLEVSSNDTSLILFSSVEQNTPSPEKPNLRVLPEILQQHLDRMDHQG